MVIECHYLFINIMLTNTSRKCILLADEEGDLHEQGGQAEPGGVAAVGLRAPPAETDPGVPRARRDLVVLPGEGRDLGHAAPDRGVPLQGRLGRGRRRGRPGRPDLADAPGALPARRDPPARDGPRRPADGDRPPEAVLAPRGPLRPRQALDGDRGLEGARRADPEGVPPGPADVARRLPGDPRDPEEPPAQGDLRLRPDHPRLGQALRGSAKLFEAGPIVCGLCEGPFELE